MTSSDDDEPRRLHSGQVESTWAMWLFLSLLVLLIFKCEGVTLWPTEARPCVEAAP